MKSYQSAIQTATELCNMPNPEKYPGDFIEWSEDICELIADIYDKDFETVVEDLQDKLGLLDNVDEGL